MSAEISEQPRPEARLESGPEGRRLVVRGRLDSRTVGALWRDTDRTLRGEAAGDLVLDAAGIDYCDISGVGYLVNLRRRQEQAGGALEIRNLHEDFGRLLAMFPAAADPRVAAPAGRASWAWVELTGRSTMRVVEDMRELISFLGHLSVSLVQMLFRRVRLRWSDTFQIAESAGVNALPIVCMMGFTFGVITAFQTAMTLKRFAAEIYTADAVIVAMFRELGPLFTAIILAGRSGSAFAAEIGTMKVREEVDALTTMGLDPVAFLAVPRVLAGVLVTPLLAMFANIAGLIGGGLIFVSLGFTYDTYIDRLMLRGDLLQMFGGLFKALIFGVIVAGVGCLEGLRTGSGAKAVGESTTRSVVTSIVLIVIVDGIFGVVYYYLGNLMSSDPPKNDALIEVRDFTAAYGPNVIIDNISFDVHRGEVFIILGGSGCGKSTMLKHMIGLYEPATGHITIEGGNISTAQGRERVEILKRIGVMYQMGALFGSLNLLENVRLPMEEYTDLPDEAMDLIAKMKLSLVGLGDFTHHFPAEISGGMQKRAAIARAMALDPQILFLDEPSAGLDPITSADLDQLILRIKETLGITFVVVTHELPSIFTIADRCIMLDKRSKRIVAIGDPKELRDHSDEPWVRQFFNREAQEGES